MSLNIRDANSCRFDILALGEVMLRLDPGEGRVRTARSFRVWEGGMASHGAFIGVALAVAWFARTQRISFLHLGDLVTSATPIGLMLGRIANFINGELWGKPTDVPWAVIFARTAPDRLPRHPSQLYQFALEEAGGGAHRAGLGDRQAYRVASPRPAGNTQHGRQGNDCFRIPAPRGESGSAGRRTVTSPAVTKESPDRLPPVIW